VLSDFYSTVAGICFTLLGLWWVVVQFKYDAWTANPARRRTSLHVSMYFLVPGIMSLFAILSAQLTELWRIGFAVSAIIGLVESLLLLNASRPTPGNRVRWAVIALTALAYLLVAIVAIDPTLVANLPGNPHGIEVEGVLVSILLFIGASFAWAMFVERPEGPPSAPAAGGTPA
jgi:hypothetical protein